ncbi:MAG TPA: hypothetical protein VMZ04_03570, partial [Anaerolineae bacterium]|nr:hypothetical protein [Anaerolineae bacterium]
MYLRFKYSILFAIILVFVFPFEDAFAINMSRSEDFIISTSGINKVRFENLAFTDLTFNGSEEENVFTVRFERIIKTEDVDEFEDMLSRLNLDTTSSNGIVTFRLTHPKANDFGLFKRLFKRKEWRVKITVSGPADLDFDIAASFSEVQTQSTSGTMKIDADFSETIIKNHAGKLDGSVSFGDFTCEKLDGSFDINADFSDVTIKLVNLESNSRARASFGSTDIRLPEGTGAEFYIDKSFASVDFHTSGSLTYEGEKGSRRVLEGGGPRVDLDVDFGSITVRNDQQFERNVNLQTGAKETVVPLMAGARWHYASDGDTLALKVENTWMENGHHMATLSFDKSSASPFESIDVHETDDGLYISGINGRFFGRDLSGVRFIPPKLWLPYKEDSDIDGGDLLGIVRYKQVHSTFETPAVTKTGFFLYSISFRDIPSYDIIIVPGIGFASFGAFKLSAYNKDIYTPIAPEIMQTKPHFKEGIIHSVDIKIPNRNLLSESDITKILDIREGEFYSQEDISSKVSNLKNKQKFIKSAHYTVDSEGNITVTIYEEKTLTKDWDVDASFSRVAGVGFGPELTITSLIGPFSEISGGAQYHWANREWTYKGRVE